MRPPRFASRPPEQDRGLPPPPGPLPAPSQDAAQTPIFMVSAEPRLDPVRPSIRAPPRGARARSGLLSGLRRVSLRAARGVCVCVRVRASVRAGDRRPAAGRLRPGLRYLVEVGVSEKELNRSGHISFNFALFSPPGKGLLFSVWHPVAPDVCKSPLLEKNPP